MNHLFRDGAARICLPGGGEGGGHPGERSSARRVHLYEPRHPDERDSRGLCAWREEAPLPRQLLHLPARRPQPIGRNSCSQALLEQTNEPYAIAKIAGLKLCESYNRQYGTDFISAMPTNLYGPNDNFDLEPRTSCRPSSESSSRRRRGESRASSFGGRERVRREFLHVDDAADACVFLMKMSRRRSGRDKRARRWRIHPSYQCRDGHGRIDWRAGWHHPRGGGL